MNARSRTIRVGRWSRPPEVSSLLLVAWTIVWTLAGGAPAAPGEEDAARGDSALNEAARLEARIALLEKAIAEAKARPGNTAAAAPPAPELVAGVETVLARDAGLAARPGAGDPEKVKFLQALIEKRDGPALATELGKFLEAGPEGYPEILDFALALDAEPHVSMRLTADYNMAFAMMHLAMLHEEALARASHFLLAATRDASPRTMIRSTIHVFLPVFLRFHQGRFPDLEDDLAIELLERLRKGEGDLSLVYMAMKTLGQKPSLSILEPLIAKAAAANDLEPILDHLQERDNADVVRLLGNALQSSQGANTWKIAPILSAISRMRAPEAQEAIERYIHSGNRHVRDAANTLYFNSPRHSALAPEALKYLNSPSDLAKKRAFITRLRLKNPGILAALKTQAASITSSDVRDLVLKDGVLPRQPRPK
ncbi:MAG TPA: hypothetical protein VMT52_10170 [Planctomycetota bacterium]|nr:hypothetical protein [Planctomycetota bacterium]